MARARAARISQKAYMVCLVNLASDISRLHLNISVNEIRRLLDKKSNTNKRDCCKYKSFSFKIPQYLNNGSI